jgi:hypothetical protein
MRKDSTWISSLRPKDFLAIGNGRTRDGDALRPALAQAIVDTIAAPLLVLDGSLRVVAANPAYTLMFGGDRGPVEGLPVHALGGGLWNIPGLLALLANVAGHDGEPETYEVEQDFHPIGRRTMLLRARRMGPRKGAGTSILVVIEDITEQRARERALTQILEQKDILLHEVHHRVANSLQIIASILLVKARTADSVESRIHLRDSHKRIMSVAATQRHLQAAEAGETIELAPYLSRLCETLTTAMIDDIRPVCLIVDVPEGSVPASDALSIGLIATELVINALKHGIPGDHRLLDRLGELLEAERLGQEGEVGLALEVAGERVLGIAGNEHDLGGDAALAQLLEQRRPVHHRHHHVGHDQVDLLPSSTSSSAARRFRPRARCSRARPARARQRSAPRPRPRPAGSCPAGEVGAVGVAPPRAARLAADASSAWRGR